MTTVCYQLDREQSVPPPGIEPGPPGLQPGAQTSYARVGCAHAARARRRARRSLGACHSAHVVVSSVVRGQIGTVETRLVPCGIEGSIPRNHSGAGEASRSCTWPVVDDDRRFTAVPGSTTGLPPRSKCRTPGSPRGTRARAEKQKGHLVCPGGPSDRGRWNRTYFPGASAGRSSRRGATR